MSAASVTARSPLVSIIRHDLASIRRDSVLLNIVGLMLGILVIGAVIRESGYWEAWWTEIQILSLLGYVPGMGYLSAMLLVDERDSGVDHALQVVPVPALTILTLRLAMGLGFVLVYAVLLVMATRMIDLRWWQWLPPILSLSLASVWTTVTVPALARDKVQALGLFKGLNLYVQVAALHLFLADRWYADLLLLSPATWAVRSIQAMADGRTMHGYAWAVGGAVFWIGLIAVSITRFRRRLHRAS
ncbi:MAG: hypothetical protein ACYC2K_15785 [Gemmatimonadales bacterium]